MNRRLLSLVLSGGIVALALASLSLFSSGEPTEPAAQPIADTTFLNLDFEVAPAGTAPKGWFTGGQGYEVTLDSEVVQSGERSLRMRYVREGRVGEDPVPGSFGVATGTFPVADAAGHTVRYRGWIRTEDVQDGWAGLWWRIDGPGGTSLGFDNMADRGPRGTTEWTSYALELEVPEGAVNINFGVLLPGTGTAWFDGLQVELDGEPYVQVEPIPFEPTEAQLAWLRQTAVPLKTDDPDADLDDLAPLKEMLGDARIVALGEGTHGTREFFRMKHRLVRFLVEEMGFTVFGIEATLPESRSVDEYVRTGEGDPKKALAGLYFWTWNTEEVLAMIEWMRSYNSALTNRASQSVSPEDVSPVAVAPVEFWGFDLQFPDIAMDNVESFVEAADPQALVEVRKHYDGVRAALAEARELRRQGGRGTNPSELRRHHERWREGALRALELLGDRRDGYRAQEDVSREEAAWALRNARVVVQGAEAGMDGGSSRDASMAENVEWILEQHPPGTKMVLWAHNGHVSELDGGPYAPMGHHLAERYGGEYVSVGFAFHGGRYTAFGKNGLGTYGTTTSRPGTFEWAFHRTGQARLLLDLRRASEDSELSGWLHDELEMRSIGAMAMDDAFYPFDLPGAFDLLIFLDRTGPSRRLGSPASP